MKKSNPLKPSPQLLVKLGSIIVHYEEWDSEKGHHFDRATAGALMNDAEVKEWFDEMRKMSFLPVKR